MSASLFDVAPVWQCVCGAEVTVEGHRCPACLAAAWDAQVTEAREYATLRIEVGDDAAWALWAESSLEFSPDERADAVRGWALAATGDRRSVAASQIGQSRHLERRDAMYALLWHRTYAGLPPDVPPGRFVDAREFWPPEGAEGDQWPWDEGDDDPWWIAMPARRVDDVLVADQYL